MFTTSAFGTSAGQINIPDITQFSNGLHVNKYKNIRSDGAPVSDVDRNFSDSKVEMPVVKTKRGPRYTPVSRRQDRPNAVLWLLRSHPELKDSQIMRLVGTTKPTIAAIRDRSHWNSTNLTPQDPVTLGLCTQVDLDEEVHRSAKRQVRAVYGQNSFAYLQRVVRATSSTVVRPCGQ